VMSHGPIEIHSSDSGDVLFVRSLNMMMELNRRYNMESPQYYQGIKNRVHILSK
jgi:hypothetical protein